MAENVSELTNSFLEKYFIPTTEFLLHPKEYKEKVKQFISKGVLMESVEEQNQKWIRQYGNLKYGESQKESVHFSTIYNTFTKEEKYEFYKACKNDDMAQIIMSQYMIGATVDHEYTQDLKEVGNKIQLFKRIQAINKFLKISPYNDPNFKSEVYRGLVRWSFEEEQLDYRYNMLVKGFNNYIEPDMMYKLFSPTSSDLVEEYIEEKNKIYENYEKKDLKISAYSSVAALMVVTFTNSWKEIPSVVSHALSLVGTATLAGAIGTVAHVGVGLYVFYKTFKLVNEVYHKVWEKEKNKVINNHNLDYVEKNKGLEDIVEHTNYKKYGKILNEILSGKNKNVHIDTKTAHYLGLEHKEVAAINQIDLKEFQKELKNINTSPRFTLKDLEGKDMKQALLYHQYLEQNNSAFFLIKESLYNQVIKNDYLDMQKKEDQNYVNLVLYMSEKLIQPGLKIDDKLIQNMHLTGNEKDYLFVLGIDKIMEISMVKHPQIRMMMATGKINADRNFEEMMFYKRLSNYYDLAGIPMLAGKEMFNKEVKNIDDWMKEEMKKMSPEAQKMTKAFLVAFTDQRGICKQEVKEYVKNYLADLKELKDNPEMRKAKEQEYIKSLNDEIHKKIVQQKIIEVKNKEFFYFKKIWSFISGNNADKLESFNEGVKSHIETMSQQLGYKNGFEYTVSSKVENGVKKALGVLGKIRDTALGRADTINQNRAITI
jgi:hypothetical protein